MTSLVHPTGVQTRRAAGLQLALSGMTAVFVVVGLAASSAFFADPSPVRPGGDPYLASFRIAAIGSALLVGLLLAFQAWAAWRFLHEPLEARRPFVWASVLWLFSVPLGTAVGAYGLWIAARLPVADGPPSPTPPDPPGST